MAPESGKKFQVVRHTVLGGHQLPSLRRPFLSFSLSEARIRGSLSWGRWYRVCTTLTAFCTWVPQSCTNVCVLMSCFPCSQSPSPRADRAEVLFTQWALAEAAAAPPQTLGTEAPSASECKWLFAKEQSGPKIHHCLPCNWNCECTTRSCPMPQAL